MHDFIQKDEIGMRNKGNMNSCYAMCYEIFIGVWSLIRNACDALNQKHRKKLVINKIKERTMDACYAIS